LPMASLLSRNGAYGNKQTAGFTENQQSVLRMERG
jgi:hypothetical protein